eukprot:2938046-Rhodomonas_salina.1
MKPGRERQRMEVTAIEHMRRYVLALQRQHSQPVVTRQRTARARMVLRIPRPRLRFRPPVTEPAMYPQCDPD